MSDVEFLKLLAFVAPVVGVLAALSVIPLARWQDAREDRRRTQNNVAGE